DQSGALVQRHGRIRDHVGPEIVDHPALGVGHGLPFWSSGRSRRSLARVADRAGFPAVLLTIQRGSTRTTTRGATPISLDTRWRISASMARARARLTSRTVSAMTTMSSVPRSAL